MQMHLSDVLVKFKYFQNVFVFELKSLCKKMFLNVMHYVTLFLRKWGATVYHLNYSETIKNVEKWRTECNTHFILNYKISANNNTDG